MARCRTEREKFYPGPGLEPGPLALLASALTGYKRLIVSWIRTCPGWLS